ncbi:MAG: 50S ribosomal protein L11 methyltransferase [Myxococcota bacterium]
MATVLMANGHLGGLSYHSRLLDDPLRMCAFERAIRAAIRPGMRVLDLGAGSGVLSLLAARRGAQVVAVESMPIASVAKQAVLDNGLADRVEVIHGNFLEAPPRPVDLIISEFLGRFVEDDGMLPAIAASSAWMTPSTVFLPTRVERWAAPVGGFSIAQQATFSFPVLGMNLRSALPIHLNARHGVMLGPNTLLAEPEQCDVIVPPQVSGGADVEMTFAIDRTGRLDGIAGWFDADLGNGVRLQTTPGFDTHWGQMLFPIPPAEVHPGDRLAVHLVQVESRWTWRVTITRGKDVILDHQGQDILEPKAVQVAPPTWVPAENAGYPRILEGGDRRSAIQEHNAAAVADLNAGRLSEAAWRLARLCGELSPEEDDIAGVLYENLGIALLSLGQNAQAAQSFLRALDGGVEREQSLRLVINCFSRLSQPHNAARALEAYIERFGPHPEGWDRFTVAPCCGNRRRQPRVGGEGR